MTQDINQTSTPAASPPQRPAKLLPILKVDEDGTYTVYRGVHCKAEGCGVELTSRNRYDRHNLCREHGLADLRQRTAVRRALNGSKPRAPKDEAKEARLADMKAARAALARLVNDWAMNPTSKVLKERLTQGINEHELKAYIKATLPEVAAIPNTDNELKEITQ